MADYKSGGSCGAALKSAPAGAGRPVHRSGARAGSVARQRREGASRGGASGRRARPRELRRGAVPAGAGVVGSSPQRKAGAGSRGGRPGSGPLHHLLGDRAAGTREGRGRQGWAGDCGGLRNEGATWPPRPTGTHARQFLLLGRILQTGTEAWKPTGPG